MLVLTVDSVSVHDNSEFQLEYGTFVLGRSRNADIRIEHRSVSRKHAEIYYSSGSVVVKDLHSSNGIFVNGVKVSETNLFDEDIISIKSIKIKVSCEFVRGEEGEQLISGKTNSASHPIPGDSPLGAIETGYVDESRAKSTGSISEFTFSTRGGVESETLGATGYGESGGETDFLRELTGGRTRGGRRVGTQKKTSPVNQHSARDLQVPGGTSACGEGTGAFRDTSVTGGIGRAISGVFRGFEKALLQPFLTLLLQFEYRLLIFILMTIGVGLIAALVLFPQKKNMEDYLRNEALSHGETIAHFLARDNRVAFLQNDYERLNTKIALEIKHVQHARIIRKDGTIVAPISERYKEATGKYLISAVEAMQKGEVAEIEKVGGHVFSIVSPIKAFTEDSVTFALHPISPASEEEIIGLAQIEYSTLHLFTGNPYRAITVEAFGIQILYCLIIGFIVAFFIVRLTIPVFVRLQKDLKKFQSTGKSNPVAYLNLKELDDFMATLGEVIASRQTAVASGSSDFLSDTGVGKTAYGSGSGTADAYECALRVVNTGVIVINSEEQIVVANDTFARQMQYGSKASIEGQMLAGVISDVDVIERIRTMIIDAKKTDETRIIDTLNLSGFDMSISVSKSENGDFAAILFREPGA